MIQDVGVPAQVKVYLNVIWYLLTPDENKTVEQNVQMRLKLTSVKMLTNSYHTHNTDKWETAIITKTKQLKIPSLTNVLIT